MLEPLFLEPVMQEKIWGGRRLKDVFGYAIPSDKTGECWAISAHPNGISVVKNGRFKGIGLDELYTKEPALFGHPKSPVFPLLTKILDANDWLSVQVHPDDAYALEHEGELGKTECWYILSAEEGAEIIYGHEATSKEELRQMIEEGRWDDLLTRVPVQKGDFFFVPSGTMHAIGKGITILETQQSSDTTYRVYDFDRRDDKGELRELHIDKSIDVLNLGQPANSRPASVVSDHLANTVLVSNPFFTVFKWQISGQVDMTATAPYLLVSVLEGVGRLQIDDQVYSLTKGDHFILTNEITYWQFHGSLELLVSHPNEQ